MALWEDELDLLHEENRDGFGRTITFRAVVRGTFVPSSQARSGGSITDTELDAVLRPTEKVHGGAGGGEDRVERRTYEIGATELTDAGLSLDSLAETHRIIDDSLVFVIRTAELEAGGRLAIVVAERSDS
jgi:hypothetical protein